MADNPIQPIPQDYTNAFRDNGRWLEDVRRELNRLRAYRGVAVAVSTNGEVIIGITNTDSPRTITLSQSDLATGKIMIIKDESGLAGTNNITIATQGSETIDGSATLTISINYGYKKVYSNGTNWFDIT